MSYDKYGCDPVQRVKRAINNDEDDDAYVIIYRKIIAFSETVVKNNILRDQLT
jgi:hypothetical protein